MLSPIITILTEKLAESAAFYTAVLGFTENCKIEHPGVTLLFLQNGPITVELVDQNRPVGPAGQTVVLTFLTNSFDDILGKLSDANLPIPTPLTLPSGVQMLRFTDPSGVPISFVIESGL